VKAKNIDWAGSGRTIPQIGKGVGERFSILVYLWLIAWAVRRTISGHVRAEHASISGDNRLELYILQSGEWALMQAH